MLDREFIELVAFGIIGFVGMEFLNEISIIAGTIFGLGILIIAVLNYLSGQKRRKEEKAQDKRNEAQAKRNEAQDKRNQEKHEWERKEHELRMKNLRRT